MPDQTRVPHRASAEALAAGETGFCRSCGADIVWAFTPKGHRHPYDRTDGVSHFATCPDRDKWSGQGRKKRRG